MLDTGCWWERSGHPTAECRMRGQKSEVGWKIRLTGTFLENGARHAACVKWFAANHFPQRGIPATEPERQCKKSPRRAYMLKQAVTVDSAGRKW